MFYTIISLYHPEHRHTEAKVEGPFNTSAEANLVVRNYEGRYANEYIVLSVEEMKQIRPVFVAM